MAVDNNNLPIRLEHLCGDGEWVSALKQALEIPLAVLECIKDAAFKAFFSIQPDGPFQPYSKIKQLPSEPFVAFVERLTRAIELQVKNEGAQEQVLEEMALTNANKHCKAAILSLPLEPVPTLDDMLQQKSPDMTLSDHDVSRPCRTTECFQKPFRLQLTESLYLSDTDWHLGSLDLQVLGSWQHVSNYSESLWGRDLMAQWGVTIGILDAPPFFRAATTEEHPTQKLNWKTDSPVWVEQWPLSNEKLKALQELVNEQRAKGHIVETMSPWNSPVFVIKKANKGKWRLLHDLRQINNVIEDMGSLQPGMPSPAMLPQNWNLAIIDIKDCFFQIPLHPDDAPSFAFSVPTLNREAPRKRYHWKFLPQGMKNSPSICQWYLSSLLSSVCSAAGEAIILHYMDDVFISAPNDDLLSHALDLTIDSLVAAGFELQEEKVQRMPPWKYLGLEIEWVFLSHHQSKRMTRPQELVAELIRKARTQIRELAGCDFECIHTPIEINSGEITKAMLEHLIHENEALQFALDSYTGQISINRPAHKLFREQIQFKLSLKSVPSRRPVKALNFFTDVSGASHKSVITWKDPQTQQWQKDIVEMEGSPRVADLAAVVRTFEKFPEPFNLVSDSAYVAGVVSRAEQAVLSEVSNSALFNLLSKLAILISHREQQFYVMHIRSHTDLPGFIAKGNRRADALAAPVEMAPLPNIFGQAKISHQLFHQNAPGLVHQFHLTQEQARAIVAMCPSCQQQALPALSAGANPRGLKSCEVWQTDMTHIMSFGRQRENCQLQLKAKPLVMVKDPVTRETERPHDLITWGCGYSCVFTPSGLKWVSAKWVKPFIPKTAKPPAEAPQVASAAWRRRKHRTLSF
ncbi:hypothetical protein DUI87_29550 [Hirundo rustica rustica]|uniref:ribonuclease H n=1 Tax=Hirundo rustica rustica TaxID=333673 RepID=A0A3M0IZE4_HIRRU|nr:hypothetical protein DUI87_29550 [Hirundo rustica rustica]